MRYTCNLRSTVKMRDSSTPLVLIVSGTSYNAIKALSLKVVVYNVNCLGV
jgi:hypothetical protein